MKKLQIRTESFILGMAYSVVPLSGVIVLVLMLKASQEAGVVDWVNAIWMFGCVIVLLYFSWMFWGYINKRLKILKEEMKNIS